MDRREFMGISAGTLAAALAPRAAAAPAARDAFPDGFVWGAAAAARFHGEGLVGVHGGTLRFRN
jgi:hypothetical protein